MAVKEAGLRATHPRWWQLEGDEMAHEVCAIVDGLISDQKPRTKRYLQLTSLYEMRSLTGFNAAAYDTADSLYQDLYVPVARSLCDTVQSDIAGRQRVKPMFSTTAADWRTRRRAKKMDRFVEAVLHQQQGVYMDGWELCDDAFLDEAICGAGVTRAYVDDSQGKPTIVIDRMRPGRFKVDAREAEMGDPQNYFCDDWADEDHLIAVYCDDPDLDIDEDEREKRRHAIHNAALTDQSVTIEMHGATRIARSVLVRYAWRLPISKDKPGKEVICVPQAVLFERDYTRNAPPAVVWRWSRERCGFWGIGLIEETRQLATEFNRALQQLQNRMVLCANKRTYYRPDSVEKADLEQNETETLVPVQQGFEYPQESIVPPFTPQEVEYIQMVRSLCYESPGVPQMGATSRKEAGVTAGVAIRTLIDLATKRFSVKARYGYEYPFCALAKQIVHACAEYVEETGNDIEVALPGKRGAKSIKWSEAAIDIENLIVQISAGSALPNEPAGRMQTVSEAYQMGLMSPSTYKRLIAWPDLAAETDRESAEYEYLEELIDQYLDAEDIADAKYVPPDGYIMAKEEAMVQVTQCYFLALRDGAPKMNLDLLRNYLLQLGETIARANAPPAPPEAAMGGPGMPAIPIGSELGPGMPVVPGMVAA